MYLQYSYIVLRNKPPNYWLGGNFWANVKISIIIQPKTASRKTWALDDVKETKGSTFVSGVSKGLEIIYFA